MCLKLCILPPTTPPGVGIVDEDEKLKYLTTCRKNPVYPKTQFLCGEVQRIQDPQAVPERFIDGDWLLLAYLK